MLKKSLLTLALSLVAAPAMAYPTALMAIPSGDVLKAGTLHFGSYTFANWDLAKKEYTTLSSDLSVNLGVFDGVEMNGMQVGRLELGFDVTNPSSFIGSSFDQAYKDYSLSLAAKLGLVSETEMFPSLAVGTYYLGFPKSDKTPNFLYASASKTMKYNDLDLGQYTIGAYQISHQDADPDKKDGGLLLGGTRALPIENLSVTADYTSGMHAFAGTNLGLSYTKGDFTLSGGYCRVNDRARFNDYPYVYLDYNLPFLK